MSALAKLTPELMFMMYRAKPGSVLNLPGVRATIQSSHKFDSGRGKSASGQQLMTWVGGSMLLSGLGVFLTIGELPSTMTEEWEAANNQYMRFQKMNPIFGISSKDN